MPGDRLGRLGRLPLARQTRGDAETGELDLSGRAVHQDIGRLDVLVDEAALVDLAEGRGDRDGEAQKAPHLHGRAEQSVERLAAGVLEHQHGPTAFAHELERPHRPRPVQLILQSVFVSEAIEGGGRRVLRGGQHGQHGGRDRRRRQAPSSAEDAFAVLPQDLEATISTSAEPRGWIHLPDPPPIGGRHWAEKVLSERPCRQAGWERLSRPGIGCNLQLAVAS